MSCCVSQARAGWEIPAGTTIGPGAHLAFDEVTGFHDPITSGFGLNKAGERLFLSHFPGAGEDRVVDSVRFKGQLNGQTIGRYPDANAYWSRMAPSRVQRTSPPKKRMISIVSST